MYVIKPPDIVSILTGYVLKILMEDISVAETSLLINIITSSYVQLYLYIKLIIKNKYHIKELEEKDRLVVNREIQYLKRLLKEHEFFSILYILLAQYIRRFLFDQLTDDGVREFNNGKLDEWYSNSTRNKYRNPPAHNKYLSLKIATEAKNYVEDQLRIMEMIIKD